MTEASAPLRPSPWREARVEALEPLTPSIRRIGLGVPGWPGHRAGQHVTLRLTAPDGYQAKRDYSIATADRGDGRIDLAVDLLPEGEVSSFLHEGVEVGDALELRGPLGGHFVWEAADGGPVLLVGGGSGVVPLMAMLRERALRAPEVPMAILLAARTWGDVAFREELLGMGDGLVLALSRDAPRRAGDLAGRIGPVAVQAALARLPGPPRRAYVCGSTGFVEAAAGLLLAAGLAPGAVRTERYGGA